MDVRFTPVRFGAGYDMEEVDAFLDRCQRALTTGDGSVSAADVLAARFTETRFSEGYTMDEVDAFLDDVLAPQLRTAAGPAADTASPRTTAPETSSSGSVLHPAEQRPGFFARLLGRR